MPDLVPREDVTAWTLLGTEPRGAKAKDWLRDEETGERWLFKPRGQHSDGSVQVGDWVEWVSANLAAALGIQTAKIRLGLRSGIPGCLSRHVTPNEAWDMQSGQLWLHDHSGVIYSSSGSSRSHRNSGASPGHSVANVRTSLKGLVAPPGYDPALTAWDIFVAHLLLDALTSNRDRHEQNWSVMRPLRGSIALAPTYDLENGLGFQLLDAKRGAYLDDPSALETFAERGTATRFDGDQTTSLVSLTVTALASCSDAGQLWLGGLIDAADKIDLTTLVRPTDGVSEVAVNFAQVLLGTNVRRMRHAYSTR